MTNLATSAVEALKGLVYYGGLGPYGVMKAINPQATEKHIQRCDKAVTNTAKAAICLNPQTLLLAEIMHKGGAKEQAKKGVNSLKSIFSK